MVWDNRYRRLEYCELIADGDEVQNDDGSWRPAVNAMYTPAPDPSYTSHRVYRRLRWTEPAIRKSRGDLITLAKMGQFDFVVHGCNCQNTMGSGIAKQLRAAWPKIYEADTVASEQWNSPVAKLGNFSTYTTTNTSGNQLLTFVNAYTQLHYLPRGVDHFEYDSFSVILKKLEVFSEKRFGFPYIGMGLAGGDSERIMEMLERFAVNVVKDGGSVTLVEYQEGTK